MIFSLFIVIGSTILAGVLSIFPTSTGVSSTVTTGMQTVSQYLYIFNNLIAIDTLFSAIIIYITFEIVLLGIQMIRWFIRFIPFFGNRV
jgi:hypothetical protein